MCINPYLGFGESLDTRQGDDWEVMIYIHNEIVWVDKFVQNASMR